MLSIPVRQFRDEDRSTSRSGGSLWRRSDNRRASARMGSDAVASVNHALMAASALSSGSRDFRHSLNAAAADLHLSANSRSRSLRTVCSLAPPPMKSGRDPASSIRNCMECRALNRSTSPFQTAAGAYSKSRCRRLHFSRRSRSVVSSFSASAMAGVRGPFAGYRSSGL